MFNLQNNPQPQFGVRLMMDEAEGMAMRLQGLKPFAFSMPMVAAAGVSQSAQIAIDSLMSQQRHKLLQQLNRHQASFSNAAIDDQDLSKHHRRYVLLRMKFDQLISTFDLFADVFTQRGEHELGVMLGGLDAVAEDAIHSDYAMYKTPKMVCYLDRGPGAAIRRIRTRLPGGENNPVAIVRIPRERMVGTALAASLGHEIGHQAAALLHLTPSLQSDFRQFAPDYDVDKGVWRLWETWMSEVIADVWAVAKLGISATVGLASVLSFRNTMVFRISPNDPHPAPYIRVLLECAVGNALYPDPQWSEMARFWKRLYPTHKVSGETAEMVSALERTLPDVVDLLLAHTLNSMDSLSLADVLRSEGLQHRELTQLFQECQREPRQIYQHRPMRVLAALGQARVDGALTAPKETRLIRALLRHWALRRTSQEDCTPIQSAQIAA